MFGIKRKGKKDTKKKSEDRDYLEELDTLKSDETSTKDAVDTLLDQDDDDLLIDLEDDELVDDEEPVAEEDDIDVQMNNKSYDDSENIDDIDLDIDDLDDDIVLGEEDQNTVDHVTPDPDPELDEGTFLKQKPVKVVDEKSKRFYDLQNSSLDDESLDDSILNDLTTREAVALVSDLDDSVEDPNLVSEDDDETVEPDSVRLEDELDEEEFIDEDEPLVDELTEDVVSETPVETEQQTSNEVAVQPEQVALTSVQNAIFNRIKDLDLSQLTSMSELIEQNLYMQGQINEWSDAYVKQMTHITDWEAYANKMKSLLIESDQKHRDEIDELEKRHQIKLMNLRTAMEKDYEKREATLAKNQALVSNMLDTAHDLIAQAKTNELTHQATIDGLRSQIKAMTNRPNINTQSSTPVPPILEEDNDDTDFYDEKPMTLQQYANKLTKNHQADMSKDEISALLSESKWQ